MLLTPDANGKVAEKNRLRNLLDTGLVLFANQSSSKVIRVEGNTGGRHQAVQGIQRKGGGG